MTDCRLEEGESELFQDLAGTPEYRGNREVYILARMLGGRTCGWVALALAVMATINANLHSGYTAVPATAVALGALIAYGSRHV